MGLNFKKDYYCFMSVLPFMKLRQYGRLLFFAGMVLAFSVGSARSYVNDGENVSRETLRSFDEIIKMTEAVSVDSSSSSSAAGNLCTSLKNTRGTHSSKTPAVRTQRPVGKVAALGLLLGARFALEPPQQHNCVVVNSDEKEVVPSRSAREIAAYRQQQKALALNRIVTAAR